MSLQQAIVIAAEVNATSSPQQQQQQTSQTTSSSLTTHEMEAINGLIMLSENNNMTNLAKRWFLDCIRMRHMKRRSKICKRRRNFPFKCRIYGGNGDIILSVMKDKKTMVTRHRLCDCEFCASFRILHNFRQIIDGPPTKLYTTINKINVILAFLSSSKLDTSIVSPLKCRTDIIQTINKNVKFINEHINLPENNDKRPMYLYLKDVLNDLHVMISKRILVID